MNYCKYVSGVRILQQWVINPDDLQRGHKLLCEFTKEFEELYYQRRPDRIHFIRQSIHLLTHIASETTRIGPLSCYAQWTIETAIGNLGGEIRQDRDPYTNIVLDWVTMHTIVSRETQYLVGLTCILPPHFIPLSGILRGEYCPSLDTPLCHLSFVPSYHYLGTSIYIHFIPLSGILRAITI